jgi:hypothetical protein
MDNKKFAIGFVLVTAAVSVAYFVTESIRLRQATKKLIMAQKDLQQYKSIAEEIISSGDKEEAEIMLSSITEDERRLEEANKERIKTSGRMKTVGKTILHLLPSLLNFLGGVASSPVVEVKETNIIVEMKDQKKDEKFKRN